MVVLLGVIAMLVLYILYQSACKRSKPTTVTEASSSTEDQARRDSFPKVVYFSATAMQRSRSFHISETCTSLKRVAKICTAVACQNCVSQK
jgi:hypothetical protein